MSKRFRIVKRISKEDTGHFEDIEVDDDFVDNEMVQIIADNEYDPLYDDCESIAVALQLAGYGKVADLEAKLKALQNGIIDDETLNMLVKEHKLYKDIEAKLAEKDKAIENWQTMYESVIQTCHNDKEEIERLNKQLAETEKEIEYQESMKILAVENQNKKAIEQLEKIINLFEPYENEEKDTILCANNGISFLEYIDNQINELKGKVE